MSGSSQGPAVAINGLRKTYGGRVVLDGIDLEVSCGETLAVLGRSGTGKSVLLKLIVGLQKPDAGSIRIHGEEITGLSFEELNNVRRRMGFLFQEAALYDSLTIRENVAFPLRHHKDLSRSDLDGAVRELLSVVGLEKDSEKTPAEISGGMKKRVGLARALALEPNILLIDEPTAGLDPITANDIEDLILNLQRERNIASVMVTHDLRGAKHVSDCWALIHEGRVVIKGTLDDFKKSRDPFVSEFLEKSA